MEIISGSGSFQGRFGDHFRVGDHFGVGIISGAVHPSVNISCRLIPYKSVFLQSPVISWCVDVISNSNHQLADHAAAVVNTTTFELINAEQPAAASPTDTCHMSQPLLVYTHFVILVPQAIWLDRYLWLMSIIHLQQSEWCVKQAKTTFTFCRRRRKLVFHQCFAVRSKIASCVYTKIKQLFFPISMKCGSRNIYHAASQPGKYSATIRFAAR